MRQKQLFVKIYNLQKYLKIQTFGWKKITKVRIVTKRVVLGVKGYSDNQIILY